MQDAIIDTTVARATVARRRNEYGEYVVRAYNAAGMRLPDADYYTDCKDDAESTAALMARGRS
jgi:hypothetical protein